MARFLASFILLTILCCAENFGNGRSGSQFRTSLNGGSYRGWNYPGSVGYMMDSDFRVQESTEKPKEPKPAEKKSGGLGLGAWGIISLIVIVSMVLIAIYYFMLLYPILCRKESNYNVMDTDSA